MLFNSTCTSLKLLYQMTSYHEKKIKFEYESEKKIIVGFEDCS